MNISADGIPAELVERIIAEAFRVRGIHQYEYKPNGQYLTKTYYRGRCFVRVDGKTYRVDGDSSRVAKIRIREMVQGEDAA